MLKLTILLLMIDMNTCFEFMTMILNNPLFNIWVLILFLKMHLLARYVNIIQIELEVVVILNFFSIFKVVGSSTDFMVSWIQNLKIFYFLKLKKTSIYTNLHLHVWALKEKKKIKIHIFFKKIIQLTINSMQAPMILYFHL
jgi:hypothetical protein